MRFSCLNEQYNASPPANTQIPGPALPLREYCANIVSSQPVRQQTDYQPVTLNTTDGAIPGRGEPLFNRTTFLIDAETRPEPLASLLQGVHTGMETFEARGTGADQFGFMAIDDDYLPKRSTTLGGGIPSLVKTGGPDGCLLYTSDAADE